MGTVRTFWAMHWQGLSVALVLLGVLTCAFAAEPQVRRELNLPTPTVEPPWERVDPYELPTETDEPPTRAHPNRRMTLEELRSAIVKSVEAETPAPTPENPRANPVKLPTPTGPPPLLDAEPQSLRWETPEPPPVETKLPSAPRVPSLLRDVILPPPADVPRSVPALPQLEPRRPTFERADDAEEQEIHDALAERRFLDMIRHSAEPPLFVRAQDELKRLWAEKQAAQAKTVDPSVKKPLADVVVVTRPDIPEKTFDPIASIRMSEANEVVPARKTQTEEPPGVLPNFLPVPRGNCATCGRHGMHGHGKAGRGRNCTSCGQGQCVPGREKGGYPCESNTLIGGVFCDLYACICCPDPCYEPKWLPQADAAFFVDAARPVSQMKIGWDAGRNLILPDRSEYFWPRADGSGKGPRPVAPALGERSLRYNDLVVYTETAVGGFSTIVNFPYRSMSPDLADHASGYTDMTVGTKSLLFDCELLQLSLQMLTYIPTGNFSKGLGTGHLSLEPSLLVSMKLGPDTYFQGQISEWIPLGGDPDYAGAIFHTHGSLNHVLYRVMPDVPIIGTFEMNTWSFQDGAYTDPVLGANQRSGGTTYVSMGPGLRVFVCDKLDFGAGAAFAVTQQHFAQSVVRVMFRYRF